MVGPRLYTTAGLSDRTPAWALHIIEYTAPAPLLHTRVSGAFGMAFAGIQNAHREASTDVLRGPASLDGLTSRVGNGEARGLWQRGRRAQPTVR